MKIDFQNLNIAPMPNPKPLTVETVNVTLPGQDGKNGPATTGVIRNSSLHPYAIINGRW